MEVDSVVIIAILSMSYITTRIVKTYTSVAKIPRVPVEIVHYATNAMKRFLKRFSHEYRTKFYITRCENEDFRTRSVRKTAFSHTEWNKPNYHTKCGKNCHKILSVCHSPQVYEC